MALVRNVTRDHILGRRVEVASSFGARLRGLLGRRGWEDLDGLWIEPCTGVHSLGMRFPIDLVLVDDERRALWIQRLSPWRMSRVDLAAQAALELPAGTVERTGTRPGDRLAIETSWEG